MNAYERKTLQELVDVARSHVLRPQEQDVIDAAVDLLAYQAEHKEHERGIYIAIGPNVWGRGFSKDQALTAAGSAARKHHIIFKINDPWAYVDGMGSIRYALGSTCEEVARVEPKSKKGGRR